MQWKQRQRLYHRHHQPWQSRNSSSGSLNNEIFQKDNFLLVPTKKINRARAKFYPFRTLTHTQTGPECRQRFLGEGWNQFQTQEPWTRCGSLCHPTFAKTQNLWAFFGETLCLWCSWIWWWQLSRQICSWTFENVWMLMWELEHELWCTGHLWRCLF